MAVFANPAKLWLADRGSFSSIRDRLYNSGLDSWRSLPGDEAQVLRYHRTPAPKEFGWRARLLNREEFERALNEIPDVEPDERDRLWNCRGLPPIFVSMRIAIYWPRVP